MMRWNDTRRRITRLVIGGILAAAAIPALSGRPANERRAMALEAAAQEEDLSPGKWKYCVVLDAGHGGFDPGKIGVNQAKEKDINLSIAGKVKEYLALHDVRVVMTRESDAGLYDADTPNKKVMDMKRRIERIDGEKPNVTVSIHQNSYPAESVHGAQVFYYKTSAEGAKLAQFIQAQLIRKADPENHRQIKPNDSYYLLKKTSGVIVIVECGFLSNEREAQFLCSESYQDRIAWAVSLGILQYLMQQQD